MPGWFEPNRYDLAVVLTSVALVIFAYFIYPTELARVSAWATIFFMQVCWVGYLAYRWTWDEEPQV
ncbi:hypothetical protein GRX03_04115 [Halovenus sp. WSH3]|uniref:Uncharacterized protein n=1 Tax=Halovenus carboxidivorans TaxID=2692199 RepID=A0A6B0T6E6_9EURY|nr:hypothetical protein [Halovenus carboxidivorans]MXR50791.1 hypothetical protein [Halovenus carboxidivorans]